MDARILISLLLAFVLGSALTVIYVKHQSRVLFAELRAIQKHPHTWHLPRITRSRLIPTMYRSQPVIP